MTKEEIRRVVVEEVSRAQVALTGQPPVLRDDTKPIGDLAGFDSPLAEDVTGVILLKLQMPPKAMKCPFTKRHQGEYPTLGEVIDAFDSALARVGSVNA